MNCPKRSKLEIYMDILKVMMKEREQKATRIMYRTNLAYPVLMGYIKTLIELGLVTCDNSDFDKRTHKEYNITKFGEEALRKVGEFSELFAVKKDWRKRV